MRPSHVKIADWQADQPALQHIRMTVFVQEQHVPVEIEMDDRDPVCIHVLAMDQDQPIGTGRIDLEKQGKIGRVAVLSSYRGQGVGCDIMLALEQIAHQAQLPSVWLNAQISAQSFYDQLGYHSQGEIFQEAGIAHCRMKKTL